MICQDFQKRGLALTAAPLLLNFWRDSGCNFLAGFTQRRLMIHLSLFLRLSISTPQNSSKAEKVKMILSALPSYHRWLFEFPWMQMIPM